MDENTFRLIRWYKQDGELVLEGEAVCELETDKATIDVTAWDTGLLRQFSQAGDLVRVGDEFARIEPTRE